MADPFKFPWPEMPGRTGGFAGGNNEREMFGVVDQNRTNPRTIIKELPDSTVLMKTGGGMVKFIVSPKGEEQSAINCMLTERNYNEREYFAQRSTLINSDKPCILYTPIESFLMLDLDGSEVLFVLKEPVEA